jgi:uncharacterized protein
MNDKLSMTPRTRVRRKPERSRYDRSAIYAVIDNALYGVIAFSDGKDVHAIPTIIWRENDKLYIHGSHGSRLLQTLSAGAGVCVSITQVDGLVLARSAIAHSMNYCSVCIYGKFTPVVETAKSDHFKFFFEHWLPERWQYVRQPTAEELTATMMLEIPLTEAVLKAREGAVKDFPYDMDYPVWAGIVPIGCQWLSPQQASEQKDASLPRGSLRDLSLFTPYISQRCYPKA